jgi:POT family proton-dependent oligopeptide transporter
MLALRRHTLQLRPLAQAVSPTNLPISVSPSSWRRAKIMAALTLAMMIYTVGSGQTEGSLFLWAQDRTDRVLLGFEIPAAWFVGLPALLVLILAPVQLALLPWLQRRVDTLRLVACGLVAVVLAFVVLLPPMLWSGGHRVSMAWLIACMTLLVAGELLVAPLGLSMMLRLTPPRFVGVVVGAWYVSKALGFWLAGELGALVVR